MMADHTSLKEEGNSHFKSGNYSEALVCYTKALDIGGEAPSAAFQLAVHSNKAACYLKLQDPKHAQIEASKALEYNSNDVKALFRRCQALELLDRKEEALKDAVKLRNLDPKNKAIVSVLQRLSAWAQQKNDRIDSTESKVSQMVELVFFDTSGNKEKREQALSNLLVLAREEAGSTKMLEAGLVSKFKALLQKVEGNMKLNVIRILASLSVHSIEKAETVFDVMGLPLLISLFSQPGEDACNATSNLFQSLINGITDLHIFREEKAKHEIHKEKTGTPHGSKFKPLKLSSYQQDLIDQIMRYLVKYINSNKVSAYGRDCIIQLIIRNVTSSDGLNWTKRFLETDGSTRLMEIAGMTSGKSTIPVSSSTRLHCSVLMSKIWDDTMTDQQREQIRTLTDEYFVEQFADASFDSKLDAIVALSTLLQGPTELGNSVLAKPGIMDMLLALAGSKEIAHQLIAVEALVHATSKKDKCVGIVDTAIPVLKQLYQDSPSDNIKVRALVGMCKISSSSGTDAADKTVSDDSQLALSRSCRKFLANESKDVDLRKWSVEGLAYLTLDAEIKEELVTDKAAIQALIDIAKVGDQTVMFPAATVFVNLMNAYDKPEIMPEMKQLAEYAKQKVPEDHPKDKEEYVSKRIDTLISYGVGSAAVALASIVTESNGCKELLSRVFLALVTNAKDRGKLVQQGGGKVLIKLALDNSLTGKGLAAQALAKMAITMNPEVAFPGQRILEVVRPLLKLLHPDRTALQNFEALLALTNITSASDSARQRVVSERGVADIEMYMIDDHEMLKRAATECLCNLVLNEQVAEAHFGENDKVKLLTLYCGDEDEAVQRAACGALAILSSDYPEKLVEKVTKVSSWKDCLLQVLVSEEPGVRHRAAHLLSNLMLTNKDFCEQVVSCQLFEVLMAISKVEGAEMAGARECAQAALEAAASHELVKPIDNSS
ncbi:protein unc-45 homolog B-like isoform X2 [Watersipora subatra]|uniref:protein unc-45 homolog B-like isoform X2 n=1 Tax=Watersipora subatra TaxID=2589382 RepID=UPI00355C6591